MSTETHCWYTSKAGKRTGPYRVLWQGQTRYGDKCKLQFPRKKDPEDFFWADQTSCDSFTQVQVDNGNGQQPLARQNAQPVRQPVQPSAPAPAPMPPPAQAPPAQQAAPVPEVSNTPRPEATVSHGYARFALQSRVLISSRGGFDVAVHADQPDGSVRKTMRRYHTDPTQALGNLSEATFQLTVAAKRLSALEEEMDPVDFVGRLDQLDVRFKPDRMWASPIGNWPTTDGQTVRGLYGGAQPSFLFTTTGASQLQSYVLPGRFWPGFKQLVRLDPNSTTTGAQDAYRVWKRFANNKPRKERMKDRVLRTVSMKVGNEYYRVVRSVVSKMYTRYSNLEFVHDLIKYAGDYGRLPVLDWWVTDNHMRLRFYAMDNPLFAMASLDQRALQEAAVPMIEVWNSETGGGSVHLRGGAWRHESQTCLGHWDNHAYDSYPHRGAKEKLRDKLQVSFQALVISAEDVVAAYNHASTIDIEGDLKDWMLGELGKVKGLPKKMPERAVKALDHHSTTPGNKLATVVDAITFAAAQETTMLDQQTGEDVASRIMNRGIVIARKSGGVIRHEAKKGA